MTLKATTPSSVFVNPLETGKTGMLTGALQLLGRPIMSYFAASGSDQEPDPEEFQDGRMNDESKAHLFRLFVAWVPKLFTEHDLKPLFDQCGDVKDIIVLKDKVSGQSRGCAFVSYASMEEAEKAITMLNRSVHLPGALQPMEVRFARSHQYVQAGAGPDNNKQLFFARVPALASYADIKQLFGQFGEVEEIDLFRERRTHLSKGCGFVTMVAREAAVAAMQALDEKYVMEGGTAPIAVKWADPDLQYKKRKAVQDGSADNRMLFFAKVLRTATEDDVRSLFSRFGHVCEVNLFRAFQGAPTTKGCGLITMNSNEEAVAAITTLDSKYTWEGMDSPMVVKWMDVALQKRRREEHLLAIRQGLIGKKGGQAASDDWLGASKLSARTGTSMEHLTGSNIPDSLGDLPPLGCTPDAYKLFVGNIPKQYTEEDLIPVFETVGKVVECYVVRDKGTSESKGSAFIWYQTKAMADVAVQQFNMRHVLPDVTGEQQRPMVVRKANSRKPASMLLPQFGAAGSSNASSSVGFMGMLGAEGLVPVQQVMGGQYVYHQMMPVMYGSQLGGTQMPQHAQYAAAPGDMGLSDPSQADPAAAVAASQVILDPYTPLQDQLMQVRRVVGPAAPAAAAVLAQQGFTGPQQQGLVALAGTGAGPSRVSYLAPAGGAPAQPVQQGIAAMESPSLGGLAEAPLGSPSASGSASQTSVSYAMNASQMGMMQANMYNIQSIAGAQLSTQSLGPGTFCLTLTGTSSQVETASQIVSNVLAKSGM